MRLRARMGVLTAGVLAVIAVGTKFRCTLVADDGSEIGMSGTVTNNKGKFDIKVDDALSKPPSS